MGNPRKDYTMVPCGKRGADPRKDPYRGSASQQNAIAIQPSGIGNGGYCVSLGSKNRSGQGLFPSAPYFVSWEIQAERDWKLGAARMSYKDPKHSGRKAHGPADECQLIAKQ
jgi:hypothetical protein